MRPPSACTSRSAFSASAVISSPGASTRITGGQGAIRSPLTRPTAWPALTVSFGAKNASLGAMTVSGTTVQAAPATGTRGLPRSRSTASLYELLRERRDGAGVVGHSDSRHDRVAIGHLDRHPGLDEVCLDRVAVRAGAGQQHAQLRRLDARAVQDVQAGHLAQPLAGSGDTAQQPAAEFLAIPLEQRPDGI